MEANVVTRLVELQFSGLLDVPAGSPLLKLAAFINIADKEVLLGIFQLERF